MYEDDFGHSRLPADIKRQIDAADKSESIDALREFAASNNSLVRDYAVPRRDRVLAKMKAERNKKQTLRERVSELLQVEDNDEVLRRRLRELLNC